MIRSCRFRAWGVGRAMSSVSSFQGSLGSRSSRELSWSPCVLLQSDGPVAHRTGRRKRWCALFFLISSAIPLCKRCCARHSGTLCHPFVQVRLCSIFPDDPETSAISQLEARYDTTFPTATAAIFAEHLCVVGRRGKQTKNVEAADVLTSLRLLPTNPSSRRYTSLPSSILPRL